MMTTIEFTIPEELYNQVKPILEAQGLTVESACELFIKETVKLGRIPFEYTEEDIKEAKRWDE